MNNCRCCLNSAVLGLPTLGNGCDSMGEIIDFGRALPLGPDILLNSVQESVRDPAPEVETPPLGLSEIQQ